MPLVNTLSNLKAASAELQQKAHEHTIKPQQRPMLLMNTPSNLNKTKTVSEHTIKPQENLDC